MIDPTDGFVQASNLVAAVRPLTWSWQLHGWIIVIGALAAVSATLLGNFLVLRKMSMLGDAITHAVLPGIAAAFLITGSRNSLPMFLGAVIVGVLTALFTEWIRKTGGVDEGASMGVVFTSLFALGLVMIDQTAGVIDLDPSCVLYGSMETISLDTVRLGNIDVPRAVIVLTIVTLINLAFVVFCFKELRIASFDPQLATTMGFSAKRIHYALMVLVSVTAVACFESVGSILVVAMFVVPAAAAYMLTDRLGPMIFISVLIAILAAAAGHVLARLIPHLFEYKSTTTAGMIAVAAGILFAIAAALGPRHGVIVKTIRRQLLSIGILCDDVVAYLFRGEEFERDAPTRAEVADALLASAWSLRFAIRLLRHRGQIGGDDSQLLLTDAGRERAQRLVRSHRLWEQYLVDQAGRQADQIHGQAERFEHFTNRKLRDELARQTDGPEQDPHGRPIPDES